MKCFLLTLFMSCIFAACTAQVKTVTHEKNTPPREIVDVVMFFESVPHPLEFSYTLKEISPDFQELPLNKASNSTNYGTHFKKALNIGIYSVDIFAAYLYNQAQEVNNYQEVLHNLSEDLNIRNLTNYDTINVSFQKDDDLDLILMKTTINIEKVNQNLFERNEDYLMMLVMAGGFVEKLYLATKIHSNKPNKKLKEFIGEDKIILEELLKCLEKHQAQAGFSSLITNLKDLREIYKNVEIIFHRNDGCNIGSDGDAWTLINTPTRFEIKMSDSTLNLIGTQIAKIRNEMIK